MTFVLVAVLMVMAVAGAELVRSMCRRRLRAPLVSTMVPPAMVGAPAEGSAVAE